MRNIRKTNVKKFKLLALNTAIAGIFHPLSSWAQDTEVIDEIIVTESLRGRMEQAGTLKNVIERTEQIGAEVLQSSRSTNLTEAMQASPGVIVANECSMCGYKRIQLNGLKAEHTNIVIDSLPTHTILSGFYAIDAIATTGVDRIEVARGSGASLTTPEAIGGVVNVITTETINNTLSIDLSGGEEGFKQLGILGTLANNDGSARLTLIGQYDERDQFDADNNGVSENPYMQNNQTTARLSWDFSNTDNLTLRISSAQQEVFGGPVIGSVTPSIEVAIASEALGEAPQLFVGDDVRNQYIGNAWETTEWVDTDRLELSASWLHEINSDWNFTLSGSLADHEQDSFYEAFDYAADDEMSYLDLHFNYALNEDHLLTFGVDDRSEELVSVSVAGQAANTDGDPDTVYVNDNFEYNLRGFYIQDSWNLVDDIEIKMALRYDNIEADFTDLSKPGVEIDESIFSPRLDARYFHNDFLTSRFSIGRGFRAPLSFFETDHGLLDAAKGFEVDVNELERSLSTSYSLSYEGNVLTATASITQTDVENLSTLDETTAGVPLLTQLTEDASVLSTDIAVGWQATETLLLNLNASKFNHGDSFKSSYGVATTEEKINLTADWDYAAWEVYGALTWIGSRNLRDYGYEGYNDAAATIAKTTNAPSFQWVDLRIAKEIYDGTYLYVGGNNIFDQSQVGDEDTPLMFDAHGAYDVAYIYNLLRGRELYAGIQVNF